MLQRAWLWSVCDPIFRRTPLWLKKVAGTKAEDYVTEEYLEELHGEMLQAAANLEFERAAELRDRVKALKKIDLEVR